jgi:THO complex subunit 6
MDSKSSESCRNLKLIEFPHSDKLVVSASEDGTVNFWDQREKNVSFTLEPHKNANINRQNFGHWVGSASISSEWVATGGGPRLALYHLRNRQPFQIFDFPKEIHVTSFIDDNLLAGGETNILAQYSLAGETISEIITSGPSILSVAWQKTPNCKILTACGASNKIDVTTNFNYKDTTLNFYGKKF